MAPRPVTPLGLLAQRLEQLQGRVAALDADLGAELREAADLAGGLDPYLEAMSSPESPALAALAATTHGADWSGSALEEEMLSGHVEGRFLAMLVHATRARRVLELGLFTGYSALAMAEALPEDGVVVALELDADVARVAQDAFAAAGPAGARIRVEVGPAAQTLDRLAADGEAPFDLVFVDADKGGYAGYLDRLLDGPLLAPHALIAVDNTLMQGEPWLGEVPTSENGRAIAHFNGHVAADDRVEQVLVPLRDGITLVRRASS